MEGDGVSDRPRQVRLGRGSCGEKEGNSWRPRSDLNSNQTRRGLGK